MKKAAILLFLMFLPIFYSSAENIGYKNFSLGDSYDTIQNKCLKHDPNYTCCVLRINRNTDIGFGYYKKITMEIKVYTDNSSEEDYNNIIKYLKSKYGRPSEINPEYGVNSYVWYFNKKRYSIETHLAEDQIQVFYNDLVLQKKFEADFNKEQYKDY